MIAMRRLQLPRQTCSGYVDETAKKAEWCVMSFHFWKEPLCLKFEPVFLILFSVVTRYSLRDISKAIINLLG